MSRSYFQFQLCALGFGATDKERLDHIISFCCVERGRRRWQALSQEERRRYRSTVESPLRSVPGILLSVNAQVQAALGAEQLNVKIGDVQSMLHRHPQLETFISSFEQQFGKDARVRIVTTWVFDARDGKGPSFVELAVLCAIYSKIGAKRGAVRITRDEIWRRAHGCKSKIVFAQRCKKLPFRFTKWQVRAAIDRLYARRFFSRATYGRRQTFYSHRLTQTELEDSIFKKKTLPLAAKRQQQLASDRITTRVRAELHRPAEGPPL